MSDCNRELQVLFVNGINTGFGGSVAESNKSWEASFRSNGISFEKFDTVPRFGVSQKSRWYFVLLSAYFFPGTLFRLMTSVIFEFAYKISPFLVLGFIWRLLAKRPRRVIFSHHSACYLAFLCSYAKRIFLIHDMMFVRARSRGASRRTQRFYLGLELRIYQFAPTLLVQSYHEWRLLRHFLKKRVHLITCCDLGLAIAPAARQAGLAVISDWRRPENVHGAIQFFGSAAAKKYDGGKLNLRFFGFDSQSLVDRLISAGLSSSISVANGGVFKDLSDIVDGYFFVPIYQGAGIKRKTLEALSAGRMVVGTKAAFIGLPPWMIAGVTKRVTSIGDLQTLPKLPDDREFTETLSALSSKFNAIGEIPDLWC